MRPASVLLFILLLCFATGTQAQIFPEIPTIPEAEQTFEEGLRAYQAKNYPEAASLFIRVIRAYPLHRRTTAAYIMAARALLAQGAYREGIDLLQEYLQRFPDSRYTTEARRLIEIARSYQRKEAELPLRLTRVGILLPLDPADLPFTQALFNGIYLATEEYNDRLPDRPVQLIFRAAGSTPEASKQVARALVDRGASVIIGPLYSDEALSVAEAAEAERIPLLVPMATAEHLTRGRKYTFQVNPPLSVHARRMATYAFRDAHITRLAVLADSGSVGERMARWFSETYTRLGGNLFFSLWITDTRQWFTLSSLVTPDSIRQAGTLYMPIEGSQASVLINGAIQSLVRMLVTPRILGGPSWHNHPDPARLSPFRVTYTYPVWVDTEATRTRRFIAHYRQRYDRAPDKRGLAYIGYDTATFLYRTLEPLDVGADLARAIRRSPSYEGIALRIAFEQQQINQGLFVLGYRDGALVRIR